tara:strand:+ start:38244 stop:39500 length:1257 start_codon:yes stop_codon:yes gene_type:complete
MAMKETLILLTSSFPFGYGETFLETELPYLAQSFSKIIILPTQNISTESQRLIPNNCILNTSIVFKKQKETPIQRFISKLFISFSFPFIYRELYHLFPKKITTSVLKNLLTYSRDAVWSKRIITQILNSDNISDETTKIYSYWCSGVTFGSTLVDSKVAIISRVHRGDLYKELYPKNYIPFRALTLSKIDAIFSISENGHKYLSERYPKFKEKFKVSRLGIPIPESKQSNHKNEDGFLVIVSCSSINSNKRVALIAKSLKLFSESNPKINLKWHHFGTGNLLSELKNIIDQFPKNLTGTLHGHIKNKNLIAWYAKNKTDLFINLSKSEGIPVSIMEANSFGIPALATNVGGTSELVNNTNGWLVNQDFTTNEILNALEEALKNPLLRIEKSKAARNTCLTYFDSEKNYPKFIKKIKTI